MGDTVLSLITTLPLPADSGQVGGEVKRVSAWQAAQPRGRVEFWNAAGHLDPPVGMVQESMVATAQCDAVFDAGGAVVSPMDHVVNIAPAIWY